MNISPQVLQGFWKEGFALDLHTVSSTPKEWSTKKIISTEFVDGQFKTVEKEVQDKVLKWDTVYTPIGGEMNHLKYWKELHRAETIAISASDFLKSKMSTWKISLIIPIPPSDTTREFQPVYEIVKYIGKICSLPVDYSILKKLKSTSQLKEIDDPIKRKQVLNGAFSIQNNSLLGKNILLFDDLYRSGETLNAVSDILINSGKATVVYVLTITKTRSKR